MNDLELANHLRRLAKAAPQAAGPRVEAQLRAAFRGRRAKVATARRFWIAAALVIAGGLSLIFWHHTASKRVDETAGFIALPYAQSGVPLEQAIIVRVDVPVTALASFGVPPPRLAKQRVSAELLIGQDGVARAVRFVQ